MDRTCEAFTAANPTLPEVLNGQDDHAKSSGCHKQPRPTVSACISSNDNVQAVRRGGRRPNDLRIELTTVVLPMPKSSVTTNSFAKDTRCTVKPASLTSSRCSRLCAYETGFDPKYVNTAFEMTLEKTSFIAPIFDDPVGANRSASIAGKQQATASRYRMDGT